MPRFDRQVEGFRVFIGGVDPRVGKVDIEREFDRFGPIADVWVARNPPGFAFIVFKYADDADRAVRRMDGSRPFGSRLRVEHAVNTSKTNGGCQNAFLHKNKGKNTFLGEQLTAGEWFLVLAQPGNSAYGAGSQLRANWRVTFTFQNGSSQSCAHYEMGYILWRRLRVILQLGTERVLQLNEMFIYFVLRFASEVAAALTGKGFHASFPSCGLTALSFSARPARTGNGLIRETPARQSTILPIFVLAYRAGARLLLGLKKAPLCEMQIRVEVRPGIGYTTHSSHDFNRLSSTSYANADKRLATQIHLFKMAWKVTFSFAPTFDSNHFQNCALALGQFGTVYYAVVQPDGLMIMQKSSVNDFLFCDACPLDELPEGDIVKASNLNDITMVLSRARAIGNCLVVNMYIRRSTPAKYVNTIEGNGGALIPGPSRNHGLKINEDVHLHALHHATAKHQEQNHDGIGRVPLRVNLTIIPTPDAITLRDDLVHVLPGLTSGLTIEVLNAGVPPNTNALVPRTANKDTVAVLMNVRALGLRIVGKHAAAAPPVQHRDQMSNMDHCMPTGVLSIGIEGLGRVQFRTLVIVGRVLALILLYTMMKALLLTGHLHKPHNSSSLSRSSEDGLNSCCVNVDCFDVVRAYHGLYRQMPRLVPVPNNFDPILRSLLQNVYWKREQTGQQSVFPLGGRYSLPEPSPSCLIAVIANWALLIPSVVAIRDAVVMSILPKAVLKQASKMNRFRSSACSDATSNSSNSLRNRAAHDDFESHQTINYIQRKCQEHENLKIRNVGLSFSICIFKEVLNDKPGSPGTPYRCLAAMPLEGSTRTEVLPGCSSLDRRSRSAKIGFKPWTVGDLKDDKHAFSLHYDYELDKPVVAVSLEEFTATEGSWNQYVERVNCYFLANEITDKRKVNIILTICGSATYSLIRSLVSPDLPNTKTFDDLVSIVPKHYNPKPSVIAQHQRSKLTLLLRIKLQAAPTNRVQPPYQVELQVNSAPMVFELDTGSAVTLCSEKSWQDNLGPTVKDKLQQAPVRLRTYTGEEVKLLGTKNVNVSYKGVTVNETIYIAEGNGPNLLGRDWLQQLPILTLNQVSTLPEVQSLIRNYEEVFSEPKTGKFSGGKYRITPHTTTGQAPCELLVGRRLRTRLDLLRPDLALKVKQRQCSMKQNADKHARPRTLRGGEEVYVKLQPSDKEWLGIGYTFNIHLTPFRGVVRIDHRGRRKTSNHALRYMNSKNGNPNSKTNFGIS
ncbi:RNA-binding protein 1, partial [Clonorchis sinensis]